MKYDKLICTIVQHGIGKEIAMVARQAGAKGGTILVGKGSSESAILRFLSLDDVEIDVLLTLVTDDQLDAITQAISTINYDMSGYLFIISLGGKNMPTENGHELITVITNRGYADDIMIAARKAGATGGTVLHARGTGTPDDVKFLGITIVPEKEQVLILAERETSKAIQDAITALPCLSTPGIGIMYTIPVSGFMRLGKKE